ncbi:hypothetical protein BGW80DRAFT_1458505 [Lactifluus volemus]|nr:hypothetical protein BGW80DRAFT_1458505 [Lactifluus volemus]
MGAGTKSVPTRIQVADLSATSYGPLPRATLSLNADADDDPSAPHPPPPRANTQSR